MKKLIILILVLFSITTIYGQKKKVAVMPTIGTVNEDIKGAVESTLQEGVANSGTYTLVGRGEAFKQAMKEFDFQKTGAVDDNQLKDFGKAVGADYVCYASVYKLGINYRITYNMVDVASSEIPNVKSKSTSNGDSDLISVLDAIADDLFNVSRNRNTAQQQANTIQQQQANPNVQQQQTNTNPVQQTNQNVSQTSGTRNGEAWNPDGIEMVYVEGNGSVEGFYIGKYEVTQAQWKSIMGKNPSKFKGDNLPVEKVSWKDIQEFIKRLNARTGRKYRLLLEREWEFAAKGGTKSSCLGGGCEYSGSNSIDNVAWYLDNSNQSSHPVGTKKPNELGIYDMSGNLWEWCQDCYDSSCSSRVIRGGSWSSSAADCRVSYRGSPGYTPFSFNLGFRLACSSK